MTMHTPKFLRIGFLCLLSLVMSSQVLAQEEQIQKRRLLMETNNDAVVKALKKAIAEKNFAEIQVKVKGIMENMDQMLDLFPKGSLSEKSRAKAEIWERWDEFSKHPATVKKAAQELADAAKAGDEEAITVKFKALGEACAGCHKPFRAAKKAQ
ncbi:MAG: cytochrome c [Deltaproteobacteria bacterium]|nr:cytochrome c [Deltaproteobacteria bacterium]